MSFSVGVKRYIVFWKAYFCIETGLGAAMLYKNVHLVIVLRLLAFKVMHIAGYTAGIQRIMRAYFSINGIVSLNTVLRQ